MQHSPVIRAPDTVVFVTFTIAARQASAPPGHVPNHAAGRDLDGNLPTPEACCDTNPDIIRLADTGTQQVLPVAADIRTNHGGLTVLHGGLRGGEVFTCTCRPLPPPPAGTTRAIRPHALIRPAAPRNPELVLDLEGKIQAGAIRSHLAIFYLQVEFNDLGNAQVVERFAGDINRLPGGILPGAFTGADHINDLVSAVGHDSLLFVCATLSVRGGNNPVCCTEYRQ